VVCFGRRVLVWRSGRSGGQEEGRHIWLLRLLLKPPSLLQLQVLSMPKCLLWENCWESPSGPHCIVPGVESHTLPVSPREEMSEARPITRDLFIETLLYEQLPGPPLAAGVSSMTESLGTLDLIHCLEGR
jgi:hypothetical protein